MKLDDYLGAMMIIKLRITALEEVIEAGENLEGAEYVMDRFLRIEHEIDKELKKHFAAEMLERAKKLTKDEFIGLMNEGKGKVS